MSIFPLLLGTLSGICIATGTIFLYTGLRRPGRDRVQILFALFALFAFSSAGANLTSILEYQTAFLDVFLRLGDWTALFTVLTLIFLTWFVSEYTKVRPRIFLFGLTFVLGLVCFVAIFSPTSIHEEIFGIVTATRPWGETISQLDASEGSWEVEFFFSQLTIKRKQPLLLGEVNARQEHYSMRFQIQPCWCHPNEDRITSAIWSGDFKHMG